MVLGRKEQLCQCCSSSSLQYQYHCCCNERELHQSFPLYLSPISYQTFSFSQQVISHCKSHPSIWPANCMDLVLFPTVIYPKNRWILSMTLCPGNIPLILPRFYIHTFFLTLPHSIAIKGNTYLLFFQKFHCSLLFFILAIFLPLTSVSINLLTDSSPLAILPALTPMNYPTAPYLMTYLPSLSPSPQSKLFCHRKAI